MANKLEDIILDNNKAVAELQSNVINLTQEVVNLKKVIKYIFKTYNIGYINDEDVQDFVNKVIKEQ